MSGVTSLDVVLPTYNRSNLIGRALLSLFEARHPAGMAIRVIVVDNRSTDDTREVVERLAKSAPLPVRYVYEEEPGLSSARNAGLRQASAELVGFIDDDERVDPAWFEVISRVFRDPVVDFIGGPCVGDWTVPVPAWLPIGFSGILGIVGVEVAEPQAFGPEFQGMLMGGNAVLRRHLFDAVGQYNPSLGRGPNGLASGEDHDLFLRLQAHGARGWFIPELRIYHLVPPERASRRYFRSWCMGHGRSIGVMQRNRREPVPHFLGLPRYLVRETIGHVGVLAISWATLRGRSARAFTSELHLIDFLGYVRGRLFG